jgi:hypothetical protein
VSLLGYQYRACFYDTFLYLFPKLLRITDFNFPLIYSPDINVRVKTAGMSQNLLHSRLHYPSSAMTIRLWEEVARPPLLLHISPSVAVPIIADQSANSSEWRLTVEHRGGNTRRVCKVAIVGLLNVYYNSVIWGEDVKTQTRRKCGIFVVSRVTFCMLERNISVISRSSVVWTCSSKMAYVDSFSTLAPVAWHRSCLRNGGKDSLCGV